MWGWMGEDAQPLQTFNITLDDEVDYSDIFDERNATNDFEIPDTYLPIPEEEITFENTTLGDPIESEDYEDEDFVF